MKEAFSAIAITFLLLKLVAATGDQPFSPYVSLYESPESRCTEEFQEVCMDCKSIGICRRVGASFVVVKSSECGSYRYDVCTEAFGQGRCAILSPSLSPYCLCSNGQRCNNDPFDPYGYVVCGLPISYGECERTDAFDLDTCECKHQCFDCGAFYPGPEEDNCASYYNCSTSSGDPSEWAEEYCPEEYCFDPMSCSCLSECPPCGYIPDPEDPSRFYYCANGKYVPGICNDGTLFDGETCGCKPTGSTLPPPSTTEAPTKLSTSSKPRTTTTTMPASSATSLPISSTSERDLCGYCGFYEHPTSCNLYYECLPDGTVQLRNCPGELCFDPVRCYCDFSNSTAANLA